MRNRQLILHVGMHKTGTTSIQQSLDGFSGAGIRYVRLSDQNHTRPMAAAFAPEDSPDERRRSGHTAEQIARLKEDTRVRLHSELSNEEFHTFVISGEGLVYLPPASLRELRKFLLGYVDRIHVFAYVREPVGYSCSAFQQRVKAGYGGYALGQPNYRNRFARFISVFGRENICFKVFSRNTLHDGSVVADFCKHWDIPLEAGREVRSNESLSEPALKLVHLFNRSGRSEADTRASKKAMATMIQSLRDHFEGKFDLPAQFHGAVTNTEDMDWLDQHFGIRFEVEPSSGRSASAAEFASFIDHIDPTTVASYRKLLDGLGIASQERDSAADLLKRHFELCMAQAVAEMKPKRKKQTVAKMEPKRRSLRSRLRALITAWIR